MLGACNYNLLSLKMLTAPCITREFTVKKFQEFVYKQLLTSFISIFINKI